MLFGGKGTGTPAGDFALLVTRIFMGAALAFTHGMMKLPPKDSFVQGVGHLGFPAPVMFSYLAGLAEFGGGLLLVLGLLTRPAALFVSFTMCVAAFGQAAGQPFPKKELPLLYLCLALIYLVVGAGRFSLDNVLGGKGK